MLTIVVPPGQPQAAGVSAQGKGVPRRWAALVRDPCGVLVAVGPVAQRQREEGLPSLAPLATQPWPPEPAGYYPASALARMAEVTGEVDALLSVPVAALRAAVAR